MEENAETVVGELPTGFQHFRRGNVGFSEGGNRRDGQCSGKEERGYGFRKACFMKGGFVGG